MKIREAHIGQFKIIEKRSLFGKKVIIGSHEYDGSFEDAVECCRVKEFLSRTRREKTKNDNI